jgi:hypothetical protein
VVRVGRGAGGRGGGAPPPHGGYIGSLRNVWLSTHVLIVVHGASQPVIRWTPWDRNSVTCGSDIPVAETIK